MKAKKNLQLLLEKPFKCPEGRGALSAVIEARVAEVQAGVQVLWEEVRAIDPLRPRFRELLDKMKAGLTHLNSVLEVQDAAAELKEPDEGNLADLRALASETVSNAGTALLIEAINKN